MTEKKAKKDTKVRKIRRALNLYQPDMARELGVPLSTYQKWEYGFAKPPKHLICALQWVALKTVLRYNYKASSVFAIKNIFADEGWDELAMCQFADMLSKACLNFLPHKDPAKPCNMDVVQRVRAIWEDTENDND